MLNANEYLKKNYRTLYIELLKHRLRSDVVSAMEMFALDFEDYNTNNKSREK